MRQPVALTAMFLHNAQAQLTTAPTFAFPTLTTGDIDGDSRSENIGKRDASVATTVTVSAGAGGLASMGFLQALTGNRWLHAEGFQHAIGASGTEPVKYRASDPKMDLTLNPADAAITAAGFTPNVTDKVWNRSSDGLYTILTSPSKFVFSAAQGVNDGSGFYDIPTPPNAAGRPSAIHIRTMENIAKWADDLWAAGKASGVGNEQPHGTIFVEMETPTITGSNWTAANVNGFLDGESFTNSAGAPCPVPGVIGQYGAGTIPRRMIKGTDYIVTTGGVYTALVSTPTTVWINYGYVNPAKLTNTRSLILNAWYNSSADNFTTSLSGSFVDYKIPGFKYNRPYVTVFDTFNAMTDPATGAAKTSRHGMFDNLSLHTVMLGNLVTSMQGAAALLANPSFSALPSLDALPTKNNIRIITANGLTGFTAPYTGVLPSTMRVATPTLVSRVGVVIGCFNAAGVYTAVPGNTEVVTGASTWINYSTGEFSIKIASNATWPNTHGICFEQDIGNYDTINFVEGTIGRNNNMNGMLEVAPHVGGTPTPGTNEWKGFGLTGTFSSGVVTAGLSAYISAVNVPFANTLDDGSGVLAAAIAAGTAEIAVINPDRTVGGITYKCCRVQARGVHSAAITLSLSHAWPASYSYPRFPGSPKAVNGIHVTYNNHPTGSMYGFSGQGAGGFTSISPAVTRHAPGNTADVINTGVTALNSRFKDGDHTGGIFLHSGLLAEYGGPLALSRITPQVNVSGISSGVVGSYAFSLLFAANKPFSVDVTIAQSQYRNRVDV